MLKEKNNVILYVTTDNNNPMKPEKLRTEMKNLGALDAIMLDCGGSSQMYNNGKYLYSEQRKVAYWILIWTNEITPIEQICPYKEPKFTLYQGSRGEGVYWLQWQLNRFFGKEILIEDGKFGSSTKSALIEFQKQVFTDKKDWDGICGSKTRAKLKK